MKTKLDAYYDSVVEIERKRLTGEMPEDELESELIAFRNRIENDNFLPERLKQMWSSIPSSRNTTKRQNNENPHTTAVNEYTKLHADATEKIEQIRQLLSDVPSPDGAIHWGHVGDLNEVNARLERVVDFLYSNG